MLTLKDAETGHNYEVIKIHGSGAMKRHIMIWPDQRNGPAYPPCRAFRGSGRNDRSGL